MAPKRKAGAKGKTKTQDTAKAASKSAAKAKAKHNFPALLDADETTDGNAVEETTAVDEADHVEEEETTIDGDDYRTPSRGQKYVFNRDYNLLPEVVRKEYEEIKLSKTPGKTKQLNALVNRAVKDRAGGYRANVDTSEVTCAKIETCVLSFLGVVQS